MTRRKRYAKKVSATLPGTRASNVIRKDERAALSPRELFAVWEGIDMARSNPISPRLRSFLWCGCGGSYVCVRSVRDLRTARGKRWRTFWGWRAWEFATRVISRFWSTFVGTYVSARSCTAEDRVHSSVGQGGGAARGGCGIAKFCGFATSADASSACGPASGAGRPFDSAAFLARGGRAAYDDRIFPGRRAGFRSGPSS